MSEYQIPDFDAACLAKRGPVVYQENRPYVLIEGSSLDRLISTVARSHRPADPITLEEVIQVILVYRHGKMTGFSPLQTSFVDDVTMLYDTGLSVQEIADRLETMYDVDPTLELSLICLFVAFNFKSKEP